MFYYLCYRLFRYRSLLHKRWFSYLAPSIPQRHACVLHLSPLDLLATLTMLRKTHHTHSILEPCFQKYPAQVPSFLNTHNCSPGSFPEIADTHPYPLYIHQTPQ